MEEKSKELAALEDRLSRIAGTGTKITNITPSGPGQYQMYVHLDPSNPQAQLFGESPDKIRGLVIERKLDPSSLLAKLGSKKEKSALSQQLQNAGYRDILKAIDSGKNVEQTIKQVTALNKESGILNQRFRDVLRPSTIDNRKGTGDTFEAIELYQRSEDEYKRTGIYGTYLDLLSNFAATGFHNEHKDADIKEYFDAWVQDTRFLETITTIFSNLFKYSVVYILPATGKYEPHLDGISSIPGRDPTGGTSKAKAMYIINKFFSEHGETLDRDRLGKMLDKMYEKAATANVGTPIAYTVLDPKTIEAESSVFGGQTLTVTSEGLSSISEALERASEGKLSKQEKERIKLLPSKIRAAAVDGDDYVDIDGFIQTIYLRKNDFESFALPKGARVFDSFDYKEELKKADFATLDGIFNYILKVTVGDKDNPVTDVRTLDSLAQAFNTPQKAFTVVWNHTLDIEKITTSEVGEILGIKKYEPVNADITAALGITRALIDGESVSAAAGVLSSKALQSEINAARKIVEDWIYKQYKQMAAEAGFNTVPVVRWKQTVITTDSDAVTRASWMQASDRMLASRETAQLAIGLDPEAETEKLRKEVQLLLKEGIGIIGSPFQQTQDTGRPTGQPTGPKAPDSDKDTTRKSTPPPASQQTTTRSASSAEQIFEMMNSLPPSEKAKIIEDLTPSEYKNAYILQKIRAADVDAIIPEQEVKDEDKDTEE